MTYSDTQKQKDADDAEKNWHVQSEAASDDRQVVYVDAAADTGSRYAVVVTRFPTVLDERGEFGPRGAVLPFPEGGEFLVSVLAPWQTAYCVSGRGDMYMDYVGEKFLRPGVDRERVHRGDWKAIQMTINHALEVATR